MRSGVFLTPYMETDVNLTFAVFGSLKKFIFFYCFLVTEVRITGMSALTT